MKGLGVAYSDADITKITQRHVREREVRTFIGLMEQSRSGRGMIDDVECVCAVLRYRADVC